LPGKLSQELIASIIAARRHWNWGPRKLRVKLSTAQLQIVWPAESTIGEVLKRAGLTHRRKSRVRTAPYGQPFAAVVGANHTWCTEIQNQDFHASHRPRKKLPRLPHSHRRYGCSYNH
jgi:putative transposase